MSKGQEYCRNVANGNIYHGEYMLALCKWHIEQLDRENGWVYDQSEADRYITFIEMLSLTKGEWAGKDFILEPWQAFIIEMIFGWVNEETNLRRFSEVTINVPKKNGKTELLSAIALAVSWLDQEHGGQIYMAATSREQASLCFHTAKDMIKWKPELFKDIYESLAHAIYIQSLGATIKAISADASTAEGKGASLVVMDEEHEQKTNQLRDNLRSGMAARRQPLFISISTAGMDKSKPYYKHIEKCKTIINNLGDSDRHLPILYIAPEKLDWEDEKTWKISNPNYGISVKRDFLIQQLEDAKLDSSKQPTFITKHLNIWSDSYSTWIDSKIWSKCGQNLSLDDFNGCDAWLGLDLGMTGDFSALSILIPKDNKLYLFMRFWIPEDMSKTRTASDGLKFKEWARNGYVTLTDGNATDQWQIKNDIVAISEKVNIIKLTYDRAYASMLSTWLFNNEGINAVDMSQSIQAVTAPTKQFGEYILGGTIIHDNNPIMAWMMGNVLVYVDDANGNMKIHKGKSVNKVDGPTSVVNAIAGYLADYESNYGYNEIIIV